MTGNDVAETVGDPLTSLKAEHADLRRLLAKVMQVAENDVSRVIPMLAELRSALQRHAQREEEVLYALCAPRLDGEEGAVGVLRADHTAILRQADTLSGPPGTYPARGVWEGLDRLAQSVHEHMNREERVLFPFVRILLSEEEQGRLAHRLEPETG